MNNQKVPLADVIDLLRSELIAARKKGKDQELKFNVDSAEIELQVGITKEVDAKGGVKFWVYTAEAGGKAGREATQTIRLKLSPTDAKGRTYQTEGNAKLPSSRGKK